MSPKNISIIFSGLLLGGALMFVALQNKGSAASQIMQSTQEANPESFQYAAPWDKPLYKSFFTAETIVPQDLPAIKGVIVPHHLLAGQLAAQGISTVTKHQPSTIVLISPNHFSRGHADVITSAQDWKTPFGVIATAKEFAKQLDLFHLADINESVIAEEHGIYSIIPFLKHTSPNSRILVLALKESTPSTTIDNLAAGLSTLLPEDAAIIASVDFSHYQTDSVSRFHDELAMNVIQTFDFERLSTLEIDSVASVRLFLRLMERFNTQKITYDVNRNAAQLVGNPAATDITSYYSAYFSKGPKKSDPAVSILFFGDMMLDRNVKKQIDEHGKDYLFSALAGKEKRFFSGMDMVAANLEGPFVSKRIKTTKSIAFAFNPELLDMLKAYNFSLFSQANNHSYDMGSNGFQESLEYLQTAGFDVYGEQYHVDEDAVFIKNIAGKRIAFVGLNDTNSPVDTTTVAQLLEQAEKDADFTIVNIHWGQEYKQVSNTHQQDLAHIMIDAGADAIIGHHPHVVQEMEIYKNKPIFYSLGNFIFDQYFSKDTQEGLGVGLVFYKDQTSAYLFPLYGVQSQVHLMPYTQAQNFMKKLIDRSRLASYSISNFYISLPY